MRGGSKSTFLCADGGFVVVAWLVVVAMVCRRFQGVVGFARLLCQICIASDVVRWGGGWHGGIGSCGRLWW